MLLTIYIGQFHAYGSIALAKAHFQILPAWEGYLAFQRRDTQTMTIIRPGIGCLIWRRKAVEMHGQFIAGQLYNERMNEAYRG